MNTHLRRSTPFPVLAMLLVLFILVGCSSKAARADQVDFMYVANAADGTVSAIRLADTQVAWTLPIGERAAHGIAASPDGAIVYAGDAAAQEVVVIDAQRQTVVKRIPLSTGVHGIDLSPDGQTLWVGGALNNDPIWGTLTVIDTAANTIQDVVSPGIGSASHFAFTPDGSEVWIASTSTNLVWIVDTETRRVTAAIPLTVASDQQRPAPGDSWTDYLAERRLIGLNEVAISPDGRRAYAVGPTTSQLYAIDVEGRRVLKSISAGQRAHGVTVSPDGRTVWIADWTGTVSVFDAETLDLVTEIAVAETDGAEGAGANHVAFGRDGSQVYVSGIGEVIVVDAEAGRVIDRVAVGQEPHELSLEDWVAPGAAIDSEAILAASGETTAQAPSTDTGDSSVEVDDPDADLIRTDDSGSVVVEVVPLNLDAPDPTLEFQISLNTHSVELNYDLVELAVLRDDRGNEYLPLAWEAPAGGHHVMGVLKFERQAGLLSPDTVYLELELREIAKVPTRTFRWELGQ